MAIDNKLYSQTLIFSVLLQGQDEDNFESAEFVAKIVFAVL